METTGYALRDALKQWELKRDAANKGFNGSLHRFADEADKVAPQAVVASVLLAEKAIVGLQVAQMRYNLGVLVEVQGEVMTLAEAIKHVGTAGKIEKTWKTVVTGPKASPYASYDDPTVRTNDPKQERAVPVLKDAEVLDLTRQASKRAGAFKTAIATANATVLDIENLDPSLFD